MSENQSELKSRRDELIGVIQAIEAQLAQKDKIDPEDGRRLTDHEYHEWRSRAITKRRHLLEELREVKASLAQIAEEEHDKIKREEQAQWDRIESKLDRLWEYIQPKMEAA